MVRNLAFVEIVVNDFCAMEEWYTKILGFRLKGEILSNEDGQWCQLATCNGDDRLALWKPSDLSKIPHRCGKVHSWFFLIFEICDIYEFVERLKENNVTIVEPVRERTGYRITTIRDPEENQLQLYERL